MQDVEHRRALERAAAGDREEVSRDRPRMRADTLGDVQDHGGRGPVELVAQAGRRDTQARGQRRELEATR